MRVAAWLGVVLLGTGLGVAQTASSLPALPVAAGTRVEVELKTKLDTGHATVGEAVTAVTTRDVKQNGVKVLPKGSTLSGHVVEVTPAESKKSPSRVGVVFEQAVPKKGQPMALHAVIAGVQKQAPPPLMDMTGAALPPPAQDTSSDNSAPGSHGSNTLGEEAPLPPNVQGPDPEITSLERASNGSVVRASGGVISSSKGDLVLDSGTHLELQVKN